MTSRRKAFISLLSAFILGFSCCFFLFYFGILEHRHFPRHRQGPTADLAHFTRELDLNTQQQDFLKKQLELVQTRHEEICQTNREQFMKLRDEFRRSFSSILTPEQQKKFIDYNRKRDEKFKK